MNAAAKAARGDPGKSGNPEHCDNPGETERDRQGEPAISAENRVPAERILDVSGPTYWIRRALWTAPAATLGRFQPYREFSIGGQPRPSVRRLTGGGAILHDQECTLTLIAPTGRPPFDRLAPLDLAHVAADLWRSALSSSTSLDESIRVRGGTPSEREQTGVENCFLRTSPFDLVLRPRAKGARPEKVGGLALYRRGGQLMVQSSIRRSETGLSPERDAGFARRLGELLRAGSIVESDLPQEIKVSAEELVARRYGHPEWNRRR